VLLLQRSQEKLAQLAKEPRFLAHYDQVVDAFDHDTTCSDTWFGRRFGHEARNHAVAYFSAEFGLHASLPLYSGGLGVLAGDHCKSASDLDLPLVGVGFMYPKGYVTQRLGPDGWQQNIYHEIDWSSAPILPLCRPNGERVIFDFVLGRWKLKIAVWLAHVGRISLSLLDTNVEGNSPQDREITTQLYGGDRGTRLRQEIVLGIGGLRLLRFLGIPVEFFHANEGHAAFVFLELLREQIASGLSFQESLKEISKSTLFTTHTPVPAGHDVFDESLLMPYFQEYCAAMKLSPEEFFALGHAPGEPGWNMTALALRLAGKRNAVSRRHGQVSREMWRKLWPETPLEEIPIDSITNGVHLGFWVQANLHELFDKHLGIHWIKAQDDPGFWEGIHSIPNPELWQAHLAAKDRLFSILQHRLKSRWKEGADSGQIMAQGALLDRGALTIGFARRFATYKRASLIFNDIDRLKKILLNSARPVQIIFAGKAHPADDSGKALIQQIFCIAKDPSLAGHISFVEDYDMQLGRYLIQGCDLWLNNPTPPLEACGTSGQKAAVNGLPNLSILDGWWEEGFAGTNGWGIEGSSSMSSDRDSIESKKIYECLESQVIPLFYEQGSDGVPHSWVKVMKESIRTAAPRFSAQRMLKEYTDKFYAETFRGHPTIKRVPVV
jgi:starch phosphorylase